MTHHDSEMAELCQSLAKIFNISSLEVREHLSLFVKVDPTIKNCLYYLSQIDDEDVKTTAALSLEYLTKFKKSPFN